MFSGGTTYRAWKCAPEAGRETGGPGAQLLLGEGESHCPTLAPARLGRDQPALLELAGVRPTCGPQGGDSGHDSSQLLSNKATWRPEEVQHRLPRAEKVSQGACMRKMED